MSESIEFKLDLHSVHHDIVFDPTRFIVVITGRRFFKTGMALAKIAKHLTTTIMNTKTGDPLPHDIGYYAPTYSQAKEIFWDRCKEILAPLIEKVNEQDLAVTFKNGGRLRLYGTDQNPEKLRGRYKTLVINDEFAYHRPGIYEIVIRPMLSDTKGEAWFLSSPNGFNHAYKYFKRGQSREGEDTDIISYHYTSVQGGYITEEEVLAAKRDMTENKWRQEYLAEFVGMEGRIVLDWTYANTDLDVVYRPEQVIYLSCDFNVDPMCWVLAHRINGEYLYFDELVMRNTNVEKAAIEIANRYSAHKSGIIITGDSSGKNRNALMTDLGATAYPIISKILGDDPDGYAKIPNVEVNIRSSNPAVQERIDGFNRLVCSGDGVRRVRVNPYTCPKIVKSMENCRYIEGSSVIYQPGISDIKENPDCIYQNHILDAVTYLTERYDPLPRELHNKGTRHTVVSQPYRAKG